MNSLAVRLFFSATVWIILTLLSAGLLLSDLNKRNNLEAFDDRLNLLLETLIGGSKVDSSDGITVVTSIGDPRFFQPYSGWYWQINKGNKTLSRSRSMWDQVFTLDKRLIGGRTQFIDSVGNNKEQVIEQKNLYIVEREISFPGITEPITFILSGDTFEYKENIKNFDNTLSAILIFLGIGLMIAVFLQVRFGLLPLNKIKDALFKIRNGDKKKLEAKYPLEVQPLATEINVLLEHNEKIVERARTHVGNLAHVLKTPLAVITNEIDKENKLLSNQIVLMKNHIDRYLKKAHLESVGKNIKSKIAFLEFLNKMVIIFQKLYPDKEIELQGGFKEFFIYGSLEDMEELIGNLIENACKWGREKVKISLEKRGKNEVKILIEDDGPGLKQEQKNEVFARGFRVDEQTPGSGLGLNIVKDILEIYKGKIWLEKSSLLKGLKVNVVLPVSLI
jgi:signal transduction histidine kinase